MPSTRSGMKLLPCPPNRLHASGACIKFRNDTYRSIFCQYQVRKCSFHSLMCTIHFIMTRIATQSPTRLQCAFASREDLESRNPLYRRGSHLAGGRYKKERPKECGDGDASKCSEARLVRSDHELRNRDSGQLTQAELILKDSL
jgi:hypothetical protein